MMGWGNYRTVRDLGFRIYLFKTGDAYIGCDYYGRKYRPETK